MSAALSRTIMPKPRAVKRVAPEMLDNLANSVGGAAPAAAYRKKYSGVNALVQRGKAP